MWRDAAVLVFILGRGGRVVNVETDIVHTGMREESRSDRRKVVYLATKRG